MGAQGLVQRRDLNKRRKIQMNGTFTAKSFNLIHMGKEKRGVGSWPRRIRKALLRPPPL